MGVHLGKQNGYLVQHKFKIFVKKVFKFTVKTTFSKGLAPLEVPITPLIVTTSFVFQKQTICPDSELNPGTIILSSLSYLIDSNKDLLYSKMRLITFFLNCEEKIVKFI